MIEFLFLLFFFFQPKSVPRGRYTVNEYSDYTCTRIADRAVFLRRTVRNRHMRDRIHPRAAIRSRDAYL